MDDYYSWVNAFTWNGSTYAPSGIHQTLAGDAEPAARTFVDFAQQAWGGNSVTFAALALRQSVFGGVRLMWQQMNSGRPSKMFGNSALRVFEEPWPGGTTQDLLNRMIQDADLAGNYYAIVDTPLPRIGGDGGQELVRLRPDWVEHLLQPRMIQGRQVGWRRVAFAYTEDGPGRGEIVGFDPSEVVHFAPLPDPLALWRGMSWITPVVRELRADGQMTTFKQKFFENGATPNVIVTYPVGVRREDIEKLSKTFAARHEGVGNAFKTMHLGGGADATVVGQNMEQVSFKALQGAGETRIAAAAGTPAAVLGISEGLQGSALNAGNYGAARRRMADGTMASLWANAAGSLATIARASKAAPRGAADGSVRLWYDARDVPFLREDEKDGAEIQATRAQTMRTWIDSGFTPDSAREALISGDESLLVHSGLYSVQLQAPGTQTDPSKTKPSPAGGTNP